MLKLACLKTKQEIQLLIAKHCPQSDAIEAVRRMPSVRSATPDATNLDPTLYPENRLIPTDSRVSGIASQTEVVQAQVDRGGGAIARDQDSGTTERPPLVAPPAHPCNREPATPISEGRYKIRFTAGQRVRDLLQEAQDLFRNQLPSGDIEVIVERALVLLVAERKKQLFAQTDKPRRSAAVTPASTSKPNSRHIASETKRRVYLRDNGQCRFVSATGDRCCARSRLEFHHVHAFGRGGPATEQNIVLFCHAHNALLAERDYGREHIQRCIRVSQAVRTQTSTTTPNGESKLQAAHGHPIHATAPELPHLRTSQYNPTRSGISDPRERHTGASTARRRQLQTHVD